MTITINGTTGIAGVDGSAGTPAVQGTDTNTGVFFGTDTVTISTGGTAAVIVDSGQRTKFPTTIGVGNATPSTSGSGITFPATQSASSDANTLDDYEEGTFTPTLGGQTTNPTVTYTAQTGFYTKIGNVVTVFGKIATTAISGGSGFAIFAGLPFTIKNANCGAGSFAFYSNITLGAGYTQAALQPQANTTTVRISKSGTAISGFPPAIGDIGAAGVFDCEFQMTYQVA
jgi:hypothetical protein